MRLGHLEGMVERGQRVTDPAWPGVALVALGWPAGCQVFAAGETDHPAGSIVHDFELDPGRKLVGVTAGDNPALRIKQGDHRPLVFANQAVENPPALVLEAEAEAQHAERPATVGSHDAIGIDQRAGFAGQQIGRAEYFDIGLFGRERFMEQGIGRVGDGIAFIKLG